MSGWLKEVASQNIWFIFVTLGTFQLLSGWLKECALKNRRDIFVTSLDTSQLLISPYLSKIHCFLAPPSWVVI
jgi:hypothetical protein